MKNFIVKPAMLLATALLFIFSTVTAQQKFVIKGKIKAPAEPQMLMLMYWPSKSVLVKDSVIIKDGSFYFEGKLANPAFAKLIMQPFGTLQKSQPHRMIIPDVKMFYLTAGTTEIAANSLHEAEIHNDAEDEYLTYQASLKPLEKPMLTVQGRLFSTTNKDTIASLQAKKQDLLNKYAQLDIAFVQKHPDSWVSFDIVKNNAIIIDNPVTFGQMFNALAPSFKKSPDGKHMAKDLEMVQRLEIGQKAIPFTQNDAEGRPFSLASMKGKYVLIDFWASWCGPCRAEYPFLQKAYAEYKSRNFDIVGVSLDDNKKLWINSITDNKFPWTEVCDLKGRNNEVVRAYGISAIPQNFLIDPNGVIIAKNLRGEVLLEKLNEVIKVQE